MTATLALPPVLATAVVNGLCNVAVLNGVPCPRCGGQGWEQHFADQPRPTCSRCGGTGTVVAPSVEPGQRINISAVGDIQSGTVGDWDVMEDQGADDIPIPCGWVMQGPHPDPQEIPLHTGMVVGSAVATTPALPIVDGHKATNHLGPMIAVLDGGRLLMMDPGLSGYEDTTTVTDLSAALPWLPSDLVGRWAVLLGDAATTEQRCPNPECEGGWVHDCPKCADAGLMLSQTDCSASGCRTCNRVGTCPPVPLPDDPEPYTLTELELTDG